jgi:hypothetical protein
LDGVVDAAGTHRLVDLLTGCILQGAAVITVDTGAVRPVEPHVADALATVRVCLVAQGGDLHYRPFDADIGPIDVPPRNGPSSPHV